MRQRLIINGKLVRPMARVRLCDPMSPPILWYSVLRQARRTLDGVAMLRLAGNAVGRGVVAAQHRFLLNGQNLRGSIRNISNIIAEIDTPAQSVRAFGHSLTLSRTIFLSSLNNGAGCVMHVQPMPSASVPTWQ